MSDEAIHLLGLPLAHAPGKTIFGHEKINVTTLLRYNPLNAYTLNATEAPAQTPIIAGTFTRLIINVTGYTFDVGATFSLRVNGVTSAMAITFAANGIFTDTDSVAVNLNDLVNFMHIGATAGSAKVTACLVFEPT